MSRISGQWPVLRGVDDVTVWCRNSSSAAGSNLVEKRNGELRKPFGAGILRGVVQTLEERVKQCRHSHCHKQQM